MSYDIVIRFPDQETAYAFAGQMSDGLGENICDFSFWHKKPGTAGDKREHYEKVTLADGTPVFFVSRMYSLREIIEREEGRNMVTKKFGVDFHSSGGALTLSSYEVSDEPVITGTHTRTHDDGWTITGVVIEDYYTWVNDFEAIHPQFGTVKGNFETEVRASSEEAFEHFWQNHQPEAWDYWDI